MKKLFKQVVLIVSFIIWDQSAFAQSCGNLNIQLQADLPSTCNMMVMTMMHDNLARPYLYVANKEAGLKIYDITSIASPLPVASVPISLYDSLDVMNVSQDGNYLYLALGNSFTSPQKAGMAIVDVTDPLLPAITDFYVLQSSSSGAGIVKVEGNYAYLGAMQSGLIILDITDKNNIIFSSQFIPGINYPPVANPDQTKINARGMEVKNSIVYLCYDAGGIRIINCTDKLLPVETGHWCNPAMYTPFDHPKAYNNIVLNDTLAYVAVDYAGMEVLNISDTSNISLLGWWNPYSAPNSNWFTSAVHGNEIYYESTCKKVFMSTGKSDMMVIDVADPLNPDSCNFYGGTSNNIGTCGINLYQNQLYLSYICAVIPFASNWTGVKILTYDACSATSINEDLPYHETPVVFYDPSQHEIRIPKNQIRDDSFMMFNIYGERIMVNYQSGEEKILIKTDNLACGLYFLCTTTSNYNIMTHKIIVVK